MIVGKGGVINRLTNSKQLDNLRSSIEGINAIAYRANKYVIVDLFGLILCLVMEKTGTQNLVEQALA